MPDSSKAPRERLTDTKGNPIPIADEPATSRDDEPNEPESASSLWWSLSREDDNGQRVGGVHIKVTQIDYERWVITDVYVHGPDLSATDLQSVPLTQLDLIMNLIGYWRRDDHTGKSAGVSIMDGDLIADAVNEYSVQTWGHPVVTFHDSYGPGPADPKTLAELRDRAVNAPPVLPKLPTSERPQLTRPDGTDPDGFAARVAEAYLEYAQTSRAPAVKIAEESGVPIATVRSWIREARRRGKLPEGQKGKAG
jgi:hypothetical protein